MEVWILISGQSGVVERERTRGPERWLSHKGYHQLNAHHVPCTVLMVIITTFTEHSPATRLCFSEVLFNPHSDLGKKVLPFLFTGRLKNMVQVTQFRKWSSQILIHSCLPGLRACPLLRVTGQLSLDGVGGVGRAARVRGTAWATAWQGKHLMTSELGMEEAETNEGWECWAGIWWAFVAMETKSELDPYSSGLSVTSS